jgi:Family of unknown function (DUF6491)
MKLSTALICAMCLAAASAQAAEKPAAGKCFYLKDVQNHTVGDDRTLYLNVGGRSVYKVGMSNNCLGGASSSDPIVIKERGSSNICQAIDLDIGATVNGGALPSRCIVDTITRLTPAQAAALPAKVKP